MEAAAELALRLRAAANGRLAGQEPLLLVAAPLLALLAARAVHAAAAHVADRGLRAVLITLAMAALKLVPGVGGYIAAQKSKVVEQLQSGSASSKKNLRTELPAIGDPDGVIGELQALKDKDVRWQGKCSGTVYIAGSESEGHFSLINKAYSMFSHTNPLHQDVFKSVAQLEAEVVAMTAALLGSKEKASGGQICGNMTSGGTESILLAVKTSRDYMQSKRGITKPEMIIAESAHSAYDKAAQYFNIKVRRVPVNKEFLADVKGFKRCINGNTIMMVGSAPGFPHGLIDPIEELGELASQYGICLHVDLCLGGFVLPFARKLGYPIPPFDFSVEGVTSISTDVHKYGLAPKGTSTVLYRNHEIRKHQFVAVTEWTGGLYVSPTMAGSRPGGLIAGAWAAMMSLGLNGYLESTGQIMEVSKKIQKGIDDISGLFVIGKPDMTVVAFGSDAVDIFAAMHASARLLRRLSSSSSSRSLRRLPFHPSPPSPPHPSPLPPHWTLTRALLPHLAAPRFSTISCASTPSLRLGECGALGTPAIPLAEKSEGEEEVESAAARHDTDAFAAVELALDSVVKVFTVSSGPNYFLPWQNKAQRESMGSGFVISGKRIITNAHVVADHTFVLVRKHGSPTKFKAEVQAIGHECDLALLTVESEEFWEGMNSLDLGDIPFLQEAVAVVGYPQGGDNISVTKGVVSRVEPTQYAHGATQLMAIQIDAAINPGNSGGPAIMGDKVAGVAFQNLSGAENIGYIIPVPVIKRFISGVEESGKYSGFCSLGISCQATENIQIRECFGMRPEMTGVLVSRINPLSDAHKILKKDDILLEFDGVPIANDGTVPFRNRERITFDHLVSMKKPEETAVIKVLRDGKEHELNVTLRPLQPLVPVHQFDKLPSYYIFAGFVFIPLTQPYLHEFGEDWYNTSPRRLCERALRELPKKAGQQLVILSQVLMDDINVGYERLAELQVKKVNGVEVENLKHLCSIVDNCTEENLRIDLDDERVIVLKFQNARLATSRILKRHRIPSARSSDLVDEQSSSGETEVSCTN